MAAVSRARRAFRGIVVDCEDLTKWDGIGAQIFLNRFARGDDEWSVVRAPKGEKLGDAGGIDAVILTGSHYSANDDEPWIEELCAWLRAAVLDREGPRVFAACFGHQVLARALGGTVGPNPTGEFYFRAAEVEPLPALARLPWAEGIVEAAGEGGAGPPTVRASGFPTALGPLSGDFADPPHRDASLRPAEPSASLRILKSHGDAVTSLPPGAVLLGRSPGVACEAYAVCLGDAAASLEAGESPDWGAVRAIAVQGHAEFTPALMRGKILPALREREEEAGRFEATADCPCHDWSVLTIADRFLRRQGEGAADR